MKKIWVSSDEGAEFDTEREKNFKYAKYMVIEKLQIWKNACIID